MSAVYNETPETNWYPSLRIQTLTNQLLPISDGFSRSVLEHQIELRACLLRDIELIRARLKGPKKGRGRLFGRGRSGHRRSIRRGAHSRTRRAEIW